MATEWWILFKLASIVDKVLNIGHPPYFTDLLQYHKSARYTVPPVNYFLFRETTFQLALVLFASLCLKYVTLYTSSHPPIPNILFLRMSSWDALLSFSLSCPLAAPEWTWFSSKTLVLYKSLTYLISLDWQQRTRLMKYLYLTIHPTTLPSTAASHSPSYCTLGPKTL